MRHFTLVCGGCEARGRLWGWLLADAIARWHERTTGHHVARYLS
ncbi:hypothetical protein LCGC14_1181760 [marine sediment metagenome]|uniref:Uncharacterized protein n=1 Tax=marine sediment metagenome TaxID=412755 RepID=A0A0F9LLX5_9ZZZZ